MREYTCEHRRVADDGRITCAKIVLGDDQVSASSCGQCPAQTCHCQHLRFSLQKTSCSPITVRWANGHIEIWDDQPPLVSFLHSACALKIVAVSSPEDCLRCYLRQAWHPEKQIQFGTRQAVPLARDNLIPLVRAEG